MTETPPAPPAGKRLRTWSAFGDIRKRPSEYEIVTELDRIPQDLRGLHLDNPVNMPARQGVQIELPPRIRGSSPIWVDWDHTQMVPPMAALIDGLVDAASSWITEPTAR